MEEVDVSSIKWMAQSRILNFPHLISIDKPSMKTLTGSTTIEEVETRKKKIRRKKS